MKSPRNFTKNPYRPDEARVATFWFSKGVGGGDDPIGSLMASHEALVEQRNKYRDELDELRRELRLAAISG